MHHKSILGEVEAGKFYELKNNIPMSCLKTKHSFQIEKLMNS